MPDAATETIRDPFAPPRGPLCTAFRATVRRQLSGPMSERRDHYTKTERRARRIITRYPRRGYAGMAGGIACLVGLMESGTYKRMAAETLARIPRNRKTLISWGRNPVVGSLQLLERAGRLRREALRLHLLEKRYG